ncbi:MAG: YcxB family protein [Lachnospiraceae bacterium]|nr:YcxB family protein [Lachnospiraceae bacterium]
MEFRYRYKVKASDIWQVRMYYAYASYTAVINIVCIISSIVLLLTMWKSAETWFRLLMIIFFSLFTVIQPLLIYLSCRKQIKERSSGSGGGEGDPGEMELVFNEKGLEITAGGKNEKHPWKDIIAVTVRPTLVVVYTGADRGYILTNRVLSDTRKGFLDFVREKRKGSGAGRGA